MSRVGRCAMYSITERRGALKRAEFRGVLAGRDALSSSTRLESWRLLALCCRLDWAGERGTAAWRDASVSQREDGECLLLKQPDNSESIARVQLALLLQLQNFVHHVHENYTWALRPLFPDVYGRVQNYTIVHGASATQATKWRTQLQTVTKNWMLRDSQLLKEVGTRLRVTKVDVHRRMN